MKVKSSSLRKGYTTGTSAAAATKAALNRLLLGKEVNCVEVALPKGGKIIIHIEWTQVGDGYVTCSVTKD
ncbi:MAG: cobalt-precorrin-5B (C(1))-methyltransferase, partial [Nitrososphaeraceae archaeon]